MTTNGRGSRVVKLERRLRPFPPRDAGNVWLDTLDDSELEALEDAMTRLADGDTVDELPVDLRARYLDLVTAFPFPEERHDQ